jgi:hypothetical protein
MAQAQTKNDFLTPLQRQILSDMQITQWVSQPVGACTPFLRYQAHCLIICPRLQEPNAQTVYEGMIRVLECEPEDICCVKGCLTGAEALFWQPSAILCMGADVINALFKETRSLEEWRMGVWFLNQIPVYVTNDPDNLCKNITGKAQAYQELLMIQKKLMR